MELLYKPWPWYVAGTVIGLTVPALLLLGNKKLGISSTLRQICAACYPAGILFFQYDWKKDSWNLLFVLGILIGGFLGGFVFGNPSPVDVSDTTRELFLSWGIDNTNGLMPSSLYSFDRLITWKGFCLMVIGGFLVGFGTRYARGCTSGHGIMGLSSLRWTSLLATACFFAGGIIFSHFVLPYLLK